MKSILCLCLLLIVGSCEPTVTEDYTGIADLSVMSFNLRYDESADGENRWDKRKEAVLVMLQEVQPRIIGIQEGLHNQVNYLDANLSNYDCVGVGRDDGHSLGEYAAIFYEANYFELLDNGNFWLSETPGTPSLGWDANNIRICSWAKLRDINRDQFIYVFNTHFDHKGTMSKRRSSELLLQKIQKIQEIVERDAPVFITGDCNMLIGNKKLKPITTNYFTANRFGEITDNKKSFNAWGRVILSRNIDFIFYQNAQGAVYKTIVENYGVPYISDHYPIISYFNC